MNTQIIGLLISLLVLYLLISSSISDLVELHCQQRFRPIFTEGWKFKNCVNWFSSKGAGVCNLHIMQLFSSAISYIFFVSFLYNFFYKFHMCKGNFIHFVLIKCEAKWSYETYERYKFEQNLKMLPYKILH